MSVKTYRDKGYARVDITDDAVKEKLMDVLGLNEGDLIDGIVLDSKIIPVVSLNGQVQYEGYRGDDLLVGQHLHPRYHGVVAVFVDAGAAFTLDEYIGGVWCTGQALNPGLTTNVRVFGEYTKFECTSAGIIRYHGHGYSGISDP